MWHLPYLHRPNLYRNQSFNLTKCIKYVNRHLLKIYLAIFIVSMTLIVDSLIIYFNWFALHNVLTPSLLIILAVLFTLLHDLTNVLFFGKKGESLDLFDDKYICFEQADGTIAAVTFQKQTLSAEDVYSIHCKTRVWPIWKLLIVRGKQKELQINSLKSGFRNFKQIENNFYNMIQSKNE